MSSFRASYSTATAEVEYSDVDDDNEDEVSSTTSSKSSLSASPRVWRDASGFEVTTRLKHVPYHDDHDKIRKLEKHGSYDICEEIDRYKLTGFDSGRGPIRAGPILQVISVTISNESCSHWEDLEIFGEISITDAQNNTFYIYNYEEDEQDLVSTEYDYLFLKGCPITPVYTGEKVKFSLTDKKSGEIIFEGIYDVDFSINDAYPRKNIMKCPGKNNFYASMEYTKIPFAFVATEISVSIEDTNEDREGDFDIHGTIKANGLVLFEEQASDPANMEHGQINRLALSTNVLAVPIYSSLAVEIKLYSGDDEFADDEFELSLINGPPTHWLDRFCKDESYCISMYVGWDLYEDYFMRGDIRWRDNADVKWNPTPLPRVQLDDLEPPSDEKSGRALVEVFSVFVGGEYSDPLDLCGTIVVRDLDRDNTVFIFARNSDFPDALTDELSRTVSLAWSDRWFVEKDFFMFLNLKDKYGNRVCRGNLYWCPELYRLERQYDRRLCDIIRGENGYFAAMHYSVFEHGKKAKVTVTWEGDDSTVVYGVVYAAYSNYKYPSTYDKEYYQSIIFKRSVNDGVSVEKYSEILLSKSHVSAPSDCKGLRVDVKLYYEETCNNQFGVKCSRIRSYSPMFEFKADETEVKSSKCFSVKVEWPATVQSNFSKSG